MKADLLLVNSEIVFPNVGVMPGSIAIKDGRIAAVLAPGETVAADRTFDCGGRWIMPGVIDPHTHIGFGSKDSDFQTESRSAALGGVTTMLTFHRSADLKQSTPEWRATGEAQSAIDFGFHFGLTSQLHVDGLPSCMSGFGVSSAKMYLMYKGAAGASKGFTEIDDALLFAALRAVASVPGAVLGVHCENVEVIPILRGPLRASGRNDLAAWDEQSPGFLEAENVFRVCYFADQVGCPVNIVHLSSKDGLDVIEMLRRKKRSAPIHVETCSHYLSLTRDSPVGLLGKVNPPLRSEKDVEALWSAIRDGLVTTVGSDHVPRKRATKGPDLWSASAGFPGIATLLPLLIHDGWHRRGIPIERLAAVTSENVANLYRLPGKGRIAVGCDADLVVVDPDIERRVDPDELESFSDYSPYEGMRLKGWPVATFLRGILIAENGKLTEAARALPQGRYVSRPIPTHV